MPKKGKKNKKKQVESSDDEKYPEDLRNRNSQMLRDVIDSFGDTLGKYAKSRNYMQLEKDMVNRFYDITKNEVKTTEAKLLDMDWRMEQLERDHRVQLKVHEQRVQNLEYEHRNDKRLVEQDGEAAIQKEREMHADMVTNQNQEKLDIKRDLRDLQDSNQEEIRIVETSFARALQTLKGTFEQNHQNLQKQYEEQVEQLKIDLELRRKVEIHEIEERKNQHINELKLNHQAAFDEMKAYYNEITRDNLQLIKSLRDEIAEMKEREKKNQKRMALLKQEISGLSEPLAKKLEEQRELEEKLKSHTKDKLALKNLRAHYKQLEERCTEAKQDYRQTEEKYRKVEKERDDLSIQFQKAVKKINRKTELVKNVVPEKKLEMLTTQLDEKQAELTGVLTAAKLDPSIVASVTKRLEQVLGTKNRQIKDLQYQVHQCTKSYNDTIRVYESKLPALGIDPEEMGFEIIQTATSLMPARLVTKTG